MTSDVASFGCLNSSDFLWTVQVLKTHLVSVRDMTRLLKVVFHSDSVGNWQATQYPKSGEVECHR